MVNFLKSKYLLITLLGFFAIYNIGLPVVIASCPMMKSAVRASCCPDESENDRQTLNKYNDYSCCKTVIATDRNKTEFLQTQNDGVTQLHNYSITAVLYASNIFETTTFSKLILTDTHSPPLIEDIPIFKSSLLI